MTGKPSFGGASAYYRLYREDPAEARRELWEAYLAAGRSIRKTAAVTGCSRNTVRAVLKRMRGAEPDLRNRPSTPGPRAPTRPMTDPTRPAFIRRIASSLLGAFVPARTKESAAVFLLKGPPRGELGEAR